mmetsp:Transcript_20783/g.64929  ORF Transcript_20783/g.64929 Transcript_20783/m.64929 type:complete len:225 (-) Transcript_20783:487-1161(-)
MWRAPSWVSIGTKRSKSCRPATVQPMAFRNLAKSLRSAGDSYTLLSSVPSSSVQSRYLKRTSGGKRSISSGSSSKVWRYISSPTAYVPMACTCSQLRCTAVAADRISSPCASKLLPAPTAATDMLDRWVPVEHQAWPGCCANWQPRVRGCGLWYSRKHRLSFTACPRGIPSSFMSASSMSARVSSSSKPLCSKVCAYWARPMSRRKDTTGLFSSRAGPVSAFWR